MRRWASFALIGLSAMLACALAVAGAGAQEGPLTLEEQTASSLRVAWNWDGQPPAAFEVAWRPRGEDAAAVWRSARKSASERRHVITGLEAGAPYVVRVRALDASGLPLSDVRGVFATAESAPLALELQSSRELCTAGTLTEISWTISGGAAPYELSIEGEAVDVDAENVRVNCGALTESEAGDADAALTAKRVTATITDSRGTHRQAAIDVARARALPALPPASGESVWAHRRELGFEWLAPATQYSCRKPSCFAIRWRAVGAEAWAHALLTLNISEWDSAVGIVRGLADGVVYEAAAAAMRDPIELETPEALRWTAPLSGTTLTNPTGLTATATHDTVTVRWNRQPTARFWSVYLSGPDGGVGEEVFKWDAASWGDSESSVHEVVFRHLPSSTRFKAVVAWDAILEIYPETRAETTVETLALPAGHEPLKRGAQNLRATATHDSITAMWDQPFEESTDFYLVFLSRVDYPYRAARVTPVWHPNTQVTFADLEPNTDYRVDVVHMAIVRPSVEISITTSAQPSSSNEDGAAGAGEWPPPGTFQPIWPHPLRPATDDVEGSRIDRWHGGIATGLTPLHLELRSSRELCTAGTLTEVSWEISGGVAPYSLSVEGEAVNVDAENVRINCGALTEAEAGDAEADLAAKTVSAVVTDSRGVQHEAAIEVDRARALPALPPATEYGDSVWAHRGELGFKWLAPATPYSCRKPSCFAIRWRAVGDDDAAAWTHAPLTLNLSERNLAVGIVRGLADGVAYEAAAAAMRDPIELETPEALRWTTPLSGTTLTNPAGLTATATHDTVTVRWNRQPTARFWSVQLRGPGGALGRNVQSWDAASWGDPASGVHEVAFRDVPSSTDYEVGVNWNVMEGYEETSAKTSVRTLPLPAGRKPLPRGPQNLRATSTHNSISVTWDRPFSGDSSDYVVYLFETDYSLLRRLEFVYPPASQITLSDLEPETEYRVVVMHNSIVRAEDEIEVTTPAPPVQGANGVTATTRASGRSESVVPAAGPKPVFEWWADGRPTSPPLDLELQSSRELCTAGTLTEISWQISGGVAPYKLSIEGAAVDVDADNLRINCGALTEAEAADEKAALAAKTVSAVVTDSRGVQRQAALEVQRARALPAPQNVGYWSSVSGVVLRWGRVAGAGSQSPLTIHPVSKNRLQVSGLVRTRANSDGAAWSYHAVEMLGHSELFVEPPPHLRVFSAAAVRHPLELETPGALNWSDEVVYAATKPAPNVTLAATHDTVTVSWDRQPYAVGQQILVWLFNDAAGNESWQYEHLSEEPGVTGRHTVTFTNLPPNTRLRLMIAMGDEIATRHYVRTRAAPSGWTPPPAGPRNLRYELDGDILTVLWDNPYAGAQQNWLLTIENPATGNSWLTDVYGTSWTLPGWLGVFPNTQYRVTVEHRSGMPPGSSSILITTPGPPTGQQIEVPDVSPRELWLRAFFPVWPALIDERHAMTDDSFHRHGVAAVVG